MVDIAWLSLRLSSVLIRARWDSSGRRPLSCASLKLSILLIVTCGAEAELATEIAKMRLLIQLAVNNLETDIPTP